MPFAEIDANGWAVIISAIGVVLLQIVNILVNAVTGLLTARRVAAASEKLDQVREEQATKEQVGEVAEKVEAVHNATNGLTERLISTTEKEAFARGTAEERERAEQQPRDKGVSP